MIDIEPSVLDLKLIKHDRGGEETAEFNETMVDRISPVDFVSLNGFNGALPLGTSSGILPRSSRVRVANMTIARTAARNRPPHRVGLATAVASTRATTPSPLRR
jgi:hypothetical protein